MSGIAGIVNVDGAPVDEVLLREMTQHMAFRGPDAQETWVGGHVGLGHAMLRTTFEMAAERLPRTLDGRIWITADARIEAAGAVAKVLKLFRGQDPTENFASPIPWMGRRKSELLRNGLLITRDVKMKLRTI